MGAAWRTAKPVATLTCCLAVLLSVAACAEQTKPSVDDLQRSLVAVYEHTQRMSPQEAQTFAACMSPRLHQQMSSKSLHRIVEGHPADVEPKDQRVIMESASNCAPELAPK